MENKDFSLHKIWLEFVETPGLSYFKDHYTNLSAILGTQMKTLDHLRSQLYSGELVIEQVLYHMIEDWFSRTENADIELLRVLLDKSHNQSTRRTVGAISFDSSQLIGKGKLGTTVYKGVWRSREVAVKKIICMDNHLCKQIKNKAKDLIKFDGHENIVKYYCVEKDKGCIPAILIALELCNTTLKTWVEKSDCLKVDKDVKNMLADTTRGLEYLHQNKIIHMNINPGNIMLVNLKNNSIRVKLCDFGISKKVSETTSDFFGNCQDSGNCKLGWMAPEVLMEYQKHSQLTRNTVSASSDIFSLGCIFYYVLFKGIHPFGDSRVSMQSNILKYNIRVQLKDDNGVEAGYTRLILMMIAKNPTQRPPASAILKHHIFWSKVTSLQYLVAVRNSFENIIDGTEIANCVQEINNDPLILPYCEPFSSNGWIRFLCSDIQTHVKGNGTRRVRYYGDLISDLIRLIRNMHNHYATLPLPVKNIVGTLPGEFLDYWTERFPLLIDSVFMIFEKLKNDTTSGLGDYYANDYNFNHINASGINDQVLLRFVKIQCVKRELKDFCNANRKANNFFY